MNVPEKFVTQPAANAIDFRRASDFQAALLGMAAHDLRQPLQVIQSAYEWLGTRISRNSEGHLLQSGRQAITRLTEQLDRLVEALRMHEQSKRMELSPVAVHPLLVRLCEENEGAATHKAVKLRVLATNAIVTSNPVLLEGILRNLVHNAVKYTKPGGHILIGCRKRGADVRIDVYDTGIGVAPEHLPRIFEAFQQLDSMRADGLGLGLFLVRRAVELLDHRIEVNSVVSLGSRFSVVARSAA